jgi:hypothetical protein
METTRKELEMKVEQAERDYFTARDAQPDHRWGEEQEEAFGKACEALQKAYDAAGTPEFDRIAL